MTVTLVVRPVALWPCGSLSRRVPRSPSFPASRLNSVFPCGARQGTTVECTIAGADLEGRQRARLQPPGHRGRARAGPAEPLQGDASRPTCRVGPYDVRAVTAAGCRTSGRSTSRDWPEDDRGRAERRARHRRRPWRCPWSSTVGSTSRPTSIATGSRPGKGQRIFIDCWAWRVDSQLDGTLMVYDAQGKELGYSGDYAGKDPFLDFTAPADGVYIVKVWDFIYAGSGDHVLPAPDRQPAAPRCGAARRRSVRARRPL